MFGRQEVIAIKDFGPVSFQKRWQRGVQLIDDRSKTLDRILNGGGRNLRFDPTSVYCKPTFVKPQLPPSSLELLR